MSEKRLARGSKYLKIVAHIGALLTASAWGTSFISTKVLMEDGGFSPTEVFVYRFALAYLLLLLFTFKRIRSNSWRDELLFVVCGVCAGSIYFLLENFALLQTTAGNVSLLSAVSPLFTTFLMALVYKVRLGAGDLLGSFIAFAGVACIIFSHGEGLEIHPIGDIMALGSAFSWALYSILSKRLIPYYNSFFITRKLFFYGVITAAPLLFLQEGGFHLRLLFDFSEPKYLLNMLFLVVVCSAAAYIIWNYALSVIGSVSTNNYIYVQPLITMIVGYILLGEPVFALGYIGCGLIIGGLVMADKWKPGLKS